jgi:peptidoglycan/LPS O-acetylase OafA/YrhL
VKKKTKYILIIAALLIALPVINLVVRQRLLEYIFSQRYFNMLFGVLLALNYRKLKEIKIRRIPKIFKVLIISVLIYLLWSSAGFSILMNIPVEVFANKWGFIFAGAISVVIVYLASRHEGWVFEIPLLGSILAYIGSRSYSIYLCHFLFVRLRPELISMYDPKIPEWIKTSQWGLSLQFSLMWFGMIVCSEIVHWLIEKPFMALGKDFITHRYIEKHNGRRTLNKTNS